VNINSDIINIFVNNYQIGLPIKNHQIGLLVKNHENDAHVNIIGNVYSLEPYNPKRRVYSQP
jgi:hypothetical protein